MTLQRRFGDEQVGAYRLMDEPKFLIEALRFSLWMAPMRIAVPKNVKAKGQIHAVSCIKSA
jgi:hypothetical protein